MTLKSGLRLGWFVALAAVAIGCNSEDGDSQILESSPEQEVPQEELKPALRRAALDGRIEASVLLRLQREKRTRVIVSFRVPELDLPHAKRYGHPDRAFALRSISDVGGKLLSAVPLHNVHRRFRTLNAAAITIDTESLEELRQHPELLSVVPDLGGAANLREALPLSRLDVVQAAGLSGSNVTVAVVDSGVNTRHPDLSTSIVAQACFCSGSTNGDGVGCCPNRLETQEGPGSAEDDNGHGTNVAGIITSDGNVAGKGGAPGAKIVAVKVLAADGSFTFSSDVIAGLDWIIASRKDVKVVNASLGTFALYAGQCDVIAGPWKTAIDTLRANGVIFFASSGNQSSTNALPMPACVQNAVAVGAVWDGNVGPQSIFSCSEASTAADNITCFTNSSSALDVLAPGAPMTSVGLGSNGLSTYYGTSQASPMVAACSALLLERDATLTPERIESLLKASPKRINDARNGLTFPRLDCGAALAKLSDSTCTPSCTGKACGDDGCGGSCGSCAPGSACSDGACVASNDSCAGVARWVAGTAYAAGAQVADGTNKYKCRPWPYTGWCGLSAYQPGVGSAWKDAWDVVSSCESSTCTPSCSGKTCGSDGCGGTCGSCEAGKTCNASGQCISTCTPSCNGKTCGGDGCGGSCGACEAGKTCNASGQCEAPSGCNGVPNWTSGAAYAPGAHVTNGGKEYECKAWPYNGWCGISAYAPGVGVAWTDAWVLIGNCR